SARPAAFVRARAIVVDLLFTPMVRSRLTRGRAEGQRRGSRGHGVTSHGVRARRWARRRGVCSAEGEVRGVPVDERSDRREQHAAELQARQRRSGVHPNEPGKHARPAQPPFRLVRVFSLPPRLMEVARQACALAAQAAEERGRMRVWVPACRTGSLAYTFAMLLLDAAPPEPPLDL